MSYKTDYEIKLTVADGPTIKGQKTTLDEEGSSPGSFCTSAVTELQSKRIVLGVGETKSVSPDLNSQQLGFLAISADKYLFKGHCGKDEPGVFFWSGDKIQKQDALNGPQIYVNRRIQGLEVDKLTFKVMDGMFANAKESDKKVTITVTFGIATPYGNCDQPPIGSGQTNPQQQVQQRPAVKQPDLEEAGVGN